MQSETNHASTAGQLRPVLGLFSAGAIVVGGVIGTGVFLKPSKIAKDFLETGQGVEAASGYVPLIILLWVVCGIVNLCGALALAELSAMMPHAGGTYVFLREAYGRIWGFLWGWAEFWVIRSGSIAALAAGLTIFMTEFLKAMGVTVPDHLQKPFGIGMPICVILCLAGVNMLGVRWGGAVQNITTIIKAGVVAFLGVLPFLATRSHPIDFGALRSVTVEASVLAAIGAALSGIMWAYDGWGNVTVVAEEIRNPRVNLPRALSIGVIILTLLYTGANVAYHSLLPIEAVAKESQTAVAVTKLLFGDLGAKFMLAMLMISVFGALNSNVLVGPRIVFAVARDYRFLGPLRRIDPRSGTPALAIGILSAWSCLLILAGTFSPDANKRLFDVLTEYCLFGGSLFYLAAVVAVFVMRVKSPDADRPYRTWGYPVVPMVFVAFYVLFLSGMVWTSPVESVAGLLLIGTGVVIYAVARK
ncbi:MAG: amino acid permease [Planctomycetes bacterium]|nr:amino acid permease [Planctomycetota bacterium]